MLTWWSRKGRKVQYDFCFNVYIIVVIDDMKHMCSLVTFELCHSDLILFISSKVNIEKERR